MIESWAQEQTLILLAITLAVIVIEICAFLSTIISYSREDKHSKTHTSTFTSTQTLSPLSENEQDYGKIRNPCRYGLDFSQEAFDMTSGGLGIENRMNMSGTTFTGAKS